MSVESTLRHALIVQLYACLDILDKIYGMKVEDRPYDLEVVDLAINNALNALEEQ